MQERTLFLNPMCVHVGRDWMQCTLLTRRFSQGLGLNLDRLDCIPAGCVISSRVSIP